MSHHHHHHHSRNFCDPHSDQHHHPPPFPIVPKKSGSLSSTILDYYKNYGQNRDLEKYLRFRKYGRCSSTDESSVHDEENVNRLGKSLENLSILHSNLKQPEEKLHKSKSNESIAGAAKQIQKLASKESLKNPSKSDTDEKLEKKSPEDYKINIKQQQKTKSKRSQKIESNIEISFSAPQTIFPEVYQLSQLQQSIAPSVPPQVKGYLETSTETTQTDSIVQYPETPLRPIGKQTKFDVDIARPASAASSIASVSNKQRLEWDSMADVGYEKSLHRSKSFESNLTTFERNALKKFFAERGLKFEDDNIVVFASKNTPKTSTSKKDASTSARSMSVDSVFDVVAEKPQKLSKSKWEQAFRKILEEKHAKLSTETTKDKQQQLGKELWKSALKKFREKYGRHLDEQSSSDLCITYPEIHSTPIVEGKPDTSKGAIPKVKRKPDVEKEPTISTVKEQKQEIPSKVRNPSISQILEQIERMERSCQTSMISLYSKECQVEKDLSGTSGKSDEQESSSNEYVEQSNYTKDLTSATSFEFIAGAAYDQNKENISPIGSAESNKENIPFTNLNPGPTQTSSDSIGSKDSRKMSEAKGKKSIKEINSTITGSSSSASNFSTNTFFAIESSEDELLQKGIDLLNSLIDSKKIDKSEKRKVVKKIVQRLMKARMRSSKNTTTSSSFVGKTAISHPTSDAISGIQSLQSTLNSKEDIEVPVVEPKEKQQSAKSSRKNSKETNDTSNETNEINKTDSSMKDWLQPMTHSELDYKQNQQLVQEKEDKQKEIALKQKEMEEKLVAAQNQLIEKNRSENVLKFVVKERNSQLDWIEKEINHLMNLKEFLTSEKKKREMDIMQEIINLESAVECPKAAVDSEVAAVSKENTYENVESSQSKNSSKNEYPHTVSGSTAPDHPSSTTSKSEELQETVTHPPRKSSYFKEPYEKSSSSTTEWNSHINMQKLVRTRTKLKTPPDLASYARAKTQNFISKYKKSHGHLYEDGLIYTQPYSSDHYSEPINIHVAKHRLNRKKPTTDAYTSIGSSDLFLSSNSVSVPIVNSTTNTTTHHYDETRQSIAIQTTDSLLKSAPIIQPARRTCNCSGRSCNCSCKKSTIRVKKSTCDNQQQVVPQSVAYVLTFDRVKEPSPAPSPPVFTKRSEVSSQNTARSQQQTLQDYLKSSRPTFISHAEQRRKCLNELNNLRKQRNEQRNKLFGLSAASNSSLRNHLNYINPPPMQSKRIFTTKLLKQETKRRCRNLPEKLHKEQVERENRIRKGTRIFRDMFNKNLQRRVLHGEVNLSNSITVAPI